MTPELSCERCQDSLPWYVANSLSDGERAEVERHLASCGRCRVALEEWRGVATALRRVDESIPPDTASLTTWARISHQVGEQVTTANKANERTIMRLRNRSSSDTRVSNEAFPDARSRRRGHRIAELVAVVALIALSVGVFTYLAAHGSSRGDSSRGKVAAPHSTCAPSRATVNLPAHTVLGAITSVGTDDGWAVGTTWDSKQPTSPPVALLLHLKNCHWAPEGTPIPNVQLSDISMVSPDDGWAVGSLQTLDTRPLSDGTPRNSWEASQPFALHYTHGSWQQVKLQAYPGAEAQEVRMVSANEGWMLLYSGKRLITTSGGKSVGYGYSLLHYQNGTWTNLPMGFLKPSMAVTDMDARQPGDVWLIGFDGASVNNSQPAFAAHYMGGKWTTYIGAAIGAGASLQTVSEISPTDVWAGGMSSSLGSGLYHFDGVRWSMESIQGVPPEDAGVFVPIINKVVMTSPTQGWAFGYYSSKRGVIQIALRYDHSAWQYTAPQMSGVTLAFPMTAFAQTTPSQGWALGPKLIDNGSEEVTVLLYYDAGAWGAVRQQP